jgi:hypothetical protein
MAQRCASLIELELDPSAQRRLRVTEPLHVVELDVIAFVTPLRVVAVLLAAASIDARSLQVSVGVRRDPHSHPRRWDRQTTNAL